MASGVEYKHFMRKEGAYMQNTERQELMAVINELFDQLTYEEQEEIINLIKSKRQNDAE